MKINQLVLTVAAISLCSITQAFAGDSHRNASGISINVHAYDYVAPVISHYPNTIYYSRTPTVVYYGAPTVIQYVPIIRYDNNGGYGRNETRQYRQPERHYYREWNRGWGNNDRDSYKRNGSQRNGGGHRHSDRD